LVWPCFAEVGTDQAYKDREKQAAYQNAWMKQRRTEWVAAKGGLCVQCGSTDRVMVVIPGSKLHSVWAWSAAKRAALLVDAYLLCFGCNNKKAVANRPKKAPVHGRENTYGKHGCRCPACCAAKAAAEARRYRLKHPVESLRRPRRPQRSLPELQAHLLGLLLHQAKRKAKQDAFAKETVRRVLAERARLTPPSLKVLVKTLEETPACNDPIWNTLAEPTWLALLATPGGLVASDASAAGRKAGLGYSLSWEALAWLELQGLARWGGGRWQAT